MNHSGAVVSTAGWRTVTVRRAEPGGETPPEPAGEDARATTSRFLVPLHGKITVQASREL